MLARFLLLLKCFLLFIWLVNINISYANLTLDLAFDLTKITDKKLAVCLTQQAKEQHWKKLSDVIAIKCHGKEIANIAGLERFSNLEKLSLFNNKLTHVDLHTFKKLKHINIANNKLIRINIIGLSQLQSLYLFKNKLTTVNFKGLSQLKKIRITNNKLKKIDISTLISLEKAYFFDNKLEDLIVTELPKLKFIELRQNPMPDEVYDRYDALEGITIIHDGNADDWK